MAQAQAQTNGNKEHVLRELQRHAVAIYLSEIGSERVSDLERRFGLCFGLDSHTVRRILRELVNEGKLVMWFDDFQADFAFLPRSTWAREAHQLVRGLDLERSRELRQELSALELCDVSIIDDLLQVDEK